ncbi:hypothetical protein F4810DRAFT_715106 [Neofusicoccum parvum]|nr:hypothetical protein F4810DRAFT_715106 [Neofusicoccum parvum]
MASYEDGLVRDFWGRFFRLFRHPSEIPSFCRDVVSDTRAYYAAEDAHGMDRSELIEVLAHARKTAIKMTAAALFLMVLVALGMNQKCNGEKKKMSQNF